MSGREKSWPRVGHLREIATLNDKTRPMTRTRKRGERRARNALKVK